MKNCPLSLECTSISSGKNRFCNKKLDRCLAGQYPFETTGPGEHFDTSRLENGAVEHEIERKVGFFLGFSSILQEKKKRKSVL
jgi:hypothetical protein